MCETMMPPLMMMAMRADERFFAGASSAKKATKFAHAPAVQ